MALVCRIKQSKLKTLTNQFKRCYFQIPGPCSFNHTASGTKFWVLDQPNQAIYRTQFEFCNSVRFFAAPIKAKPKQQEKLKSTPHLNDQITAEFVRLVVDEEHWVVSRREALERAKRLKLDLVEVDRLSKPPVCKIMDYTKERYKQQIKDKERAKSRAELSLKSDCKEVRFSGKIKQNDLQMKADMAKRLLESGYRVKCLAVGTEEQDLNGLLLRLSAMIEDVAIVESGPEEDKKGAHIMVRHVKFGRSKKGSGKKASKGEAEKLSTSPGTLATEEDILSASLEIPDKDLENTESTWSDFHATDDFDQVFDISDDLNSIAENYTDEQMKVAPEAKFSPANVSSDFALPASVLDSIKENAVPSSRLDARLGTGSGAQDPTRLDPTLSNQRMQRDSKFSPSIGKPKQVDEADASLFRNLRLPADEFPKQELPCPSRPSSAPSRFGIFSSPKANDAPFSSPKANDAAFNGFNKNGKPSNSTRNHSAGQVSENRNLTKSNSNGSQRPGIDKDGKGSWGIFSRESSNVVSNRNSESHADSQR